MPPEDRPADDRPDDKLWDAISEYAEACGGDTGNDTISDRRMNAVVAVERVVKAKLAAAEAERDKLQAFKDWVHRWLDGRGVPHDPDPAKTAATGCRISNRMEWLLTNRAALAENEALAAKYRAESRLSEDGKPDGTREGLEQCVRMLDTYTADCFPANEKGQVHFARAMMESTADEIRAFLAGNPG